MDIIQCVREAVDTAGDSKTVNADPYLNIRRKAEKTTNKAMLKYGPGGALAGGLALGTAAKQATGSNVAAGAAGLYGSLVGAAGGAVGAMAKGDHTRRKLVDKYLSKKGYK